jgi:hypothetical protein
MAKIIWAGNTFFAPCLTDLGHEVFYIQYVPGSVLLWDELLAAAGCSSPDLFVLGDASVPPFILGVESFPCLTAFYCVDSHIHSWYPRYAQAFDLCLVSLKDHLPAFCSAKDMRLPQDRVIWCPPYELRKITDTEQASCTPKEWDLLFVGKADPAINPERVLFLQRVKELVPSFAWQRGDFRKIYSKSRLVLNHCIAGDLNFRVMEALACGVCLLTPRIRHGLQELFTDEVDLFLYDQDNLESLAALVKKLLQNPALCARVAASGLQKVNNRHLGGHRALLLHAALQNFMQGDTAEHLVRERLMQKNKLHAQYLKLIYLLFAESMENPGRRRAYLTAAQSGF